MMREVEFISMFWLAGQSMIDIAIPVMVAAGTHRCFETFYVACLGENNIDGLVIWSAVTAIFWHWFGWSRSLRPTGPDDDPVWLQYTYEVICDISGWVWLQLGAYVIFGSLAEDVEDDGGEENYGSAFLAWFLLVLVGVIILGVSKLGTHFRTGGVTSRGVLLLRNFDAISFAMPVGAIFSTIIASAIYEEDSTYFGDRYGLQTDDMNNDDSDEVKTNSVYFFLYCIFVTLFCGALQVFTGETAMDDITALFSAEAQPEYGDVPQELKTIALEDEAMSSLQHFYNTICAYTIAVSWVLFADMIFVHLFHFTMGKQIGYMIYATGISIVGVGLITCFQYRLELIAVDRLRAQSEHLLAKTQGEILLERSTGLAIAATRYSVGWLWDNFISSVVDISDTVPGDQAALRFLSFLLKFLATGIIFVAGWYYRRSQDDMYVQRGMATKQQLQRETSMAVEMNTPKKKRVRIKASPVPTSSPAPLHSPLL